MKKMLTVVVVGGTSGTCLHAPAQYFLQSHSSLSANRMNYTPEPGNWLTRGKGSCGRSSSRMLAVVTGHFPSSVNWSGKGEVNSFDHPFQIWRAILNATDRRSLTIKSRLKVWWPPFLPLIALQALESCQKAKEKVTAEAAAGSQQEGLPSLLDHSLEAPAISQLLQPNPF